MSHLRVTKKTKKNLYIEIAGHTSKNQIKLTVNNWVSVNDAISYLHSKDDIQLLLKECVGIITIEDLKKLTSQYLPTIKQIKQGKKRAVVRQQWFNDNEKQLDAMTEHMVNHPGFMSNKPF